MTKEKFRLSDLTLIIWNPQRELPYQIFVLRLIIVFLIMVGSVIYYIPNEDIPNLLLESIELTRKSFEDWSMDTISIKLLRFLMMILVIVIASRA
tara:strand:+ start:191 stop:475 length:285 start_codon:yes stop_codon:yes gene_type:complete